MLYIMNRMRRQVLESEIKILDKRGSLMCRIYDSFVYLKNTFNNIFNITSFIEEIWRNKKVINILNSDFMGINIKQFEYIINNYHNYIILINIFTDKYNNDFHYYKNPYSSEIFISLFNQFSYKERLYILYFLTYYEALEYNNEKIKEEIIKLDLFNEININKIVFNYLDLDNIDIY